jgi:predicted metal-dependent hydrolase
MTSRSLRIIWLTGRSEALVRHDDLPLPVEIKPVRGARRLRLRLDDKRGLLKLTGPLRMNRKAALAWAAEQRQWVEAQLAAMLPDEPFVPGAIIPLEGEDVALVWDAALPRTARLLDGRLICGGPADGFARRIETFLKRRALEVLSQDTAEIAQRAGLEVTRVSVGDADTRWGSCTTGGRIRYSWRLILAPRAARRYVVAHEVAHLVHMNHGPDFKALERRLFDGDVASAKLLLRRWGPRLRRLGRGD